MPTVLGEFEQLLLLAVLRLGDQAYGVSIRRAIQDATGRDISAGAVYTALGRLETRGLVTSRPGETSAERTGMKRRYYTVEPDGARRVFRAYQDMQTMVRGLVPELERLAGRGRRR